MSPLPPLLSCISQNDSVAETNEDVPPESLNTLLTDISLVSLAGRQAQPLLWPDKDGSGSRKSEEGWEENGLKKSRGKGRRGRDRDVADLQAPYCRLRWLYQMRMRDRNRSGAVSATLAFLC